MPKSSLFLLCVLLTSLFSFIFLWLFYPQKEKLNYVVELASINELPFKQAQASSDQVLEISASSAYVLDLSSMSVLYEKNPDQGLYPASASKMMTALVAMDNYSLQQKLEVATESAVLGHKLNLVFGQKISVADLLASLLIFSANDSAYVLANNHPLGYAEFIEDMNQKARNLNLRQTFFINPSGIDEPGQQSTARELSVIARELLKQPYLKELVATPYKRIVSEDQSWSYELNNTNLLLGQIRGVTGVKTGTTELAGEVLITLVEREGRQILISLMSSQDRYADTSKLLAWIFNNFEWKKL